MPAPESASRPAGTATPTRPACPTAELLAAWGRGELPAETAEPVAAHVEACAACQAALGRLAGPPDALLDGLRHVRQAVAAQGELTVLTGPPVSATVAAPPGYELLERVGQGGMGVVHRARDLRLNREVAVKLLRDDYPAASAVCARFVAEAQITGQLQHPGIPAVHELGALPDGRPFLAMKLVKGRTLHELLKERSDPAQERGRFLAVFEQVCQAVGYAHAHRVLHRDLKPQNVMVGSFGEVQVMDWGLAKVLAAQAPAAAADGELPETVAALTAIDTPLAGDSATRTGAVMGTPAYMAPEQAGGEVRKLDARSDVFGLGAILCQVLTGQPPFSGKDANEVRLQAVRGELREAFARLDGAGAEPDLVALCERCLAFRQEDRPADGRAVAQEVARVRQAAEERARQAEVARAAALVREAEQRRRRRQLLIAAAAVAAVLGFGIVGTTAGLLRARQAAEAERLAKLDAQDKEQKAQAAAAAEGEAKQHAEQAAAAEKQANEQAQKRLKQIEKGNEILAAVFTDLDVRRVRQGTEPLEAVLAKRLVKAAGQLKGEAVGDPLMVATIQNRLGTSLTHLGYPRAAIPLLVEARDTRLTALGPDDPATLDSVYYLGQAYYEDGKAEMALPFLEETLRRVRPRLGADHPTALKFMCSLAATYLAAGYPDKALPLYEEALPLVKDKLGADDSATLLCMSGLAVAYQAAGKPDKALPLFEEAWQRTAAKQGANDPDSLVVLSNLADAYYRARKPDKALPLSEETLRLMKARLGADHPNTLRAMNNLALVYEAAGKSDQAPPLLEEAVRRMRVRPGPDHPTTLAIINNLAGVYCDLKQGEKAVPLFAEYFEQRRKQSKPDDPALAEELATASVRLLNCGRDQEAEGYLRESLTTREKRERDGWATFYTQSLLGRALLGQKRYAEAEPLLLQGYEGMKQREKSIPPQMQARLTGALERLVALYDAWGKKDEAAKWRKELDGRKGTESKPNG
jgi:hypothetical protein